MSTEPSPSTSNESISLAKLATIFAVVFCIAFGLCGVTAVTYGPDSRGVRPYVMGASLVVEAVFLLGLLVVGILAIVRRFGIKFSD